MDIILIIFNILYFQSKIDLICDIVKNYIRDLIIYSISGNIINLDDAKKKIR